MTDGTKFKLLSALKKLDHRIEMNSFDKRLVLQKLVYLLQELGLELKNTYGWYMRGPYSREVSNDGFQLLFVQDNSHVPEIGPEELPAIDMFKALYADAEEEFEGQNETYILELLASLHFLIEHGYPKPSDRDEALVRFLELKPQFEEDAEKALELLESHELVDF